MERFEAVEPGTLSLVSAVLPRAVKLPLMGLLLGYGLHMLRFDHRNEDGHFGFTSLIVDAIKPHR